MLEGYTIAAAAFFYLCVLFAIAYWGDKPTAKNKSIVANPYIYTLSIAVYCTSWTFYGSVGRAASSGIGFLPIYIGPTLAFILAWFLIRKIIRISKINRITSIADFIASRYGKSSYLGGLVTIIAVIGIMPYISLQLKAVSTSFSLLAQYPDIVTPSNLSSVPILADTAFYVAFFMAAFAILFGTRHIDASEHHQGMVVAIAFESMIKLLAFLAVGFFVTYGIFDGFGDIFSRAQESPELVKLFTIEGSGGYGSWASLTILSMAAIMFLPRQFQVTVVENVDEAHLKKAIWLFPLYLLLINIFVLPIAFGGLLHFPNGGVDADTFVLTLPMAEQQEGLALLAFIGGLSAATGMIIVASVALSTMVSNDLVMPVLLRVARLHLSERTDLTGLILIIRRVTIGLMLLLGYAYVRLIGDSYALVSIGLVSFTAAAQFAPSIIGGIFWKGASRAGAFAGLGGGFLCWIYTLLMPSFARSGWLPENFLAQGPFGIAMLKPYALFGLQGLDPISHALFWTMFINIGLYICVSIFTSQSIVERGQAVLFVDVFKKTTAGRGFWQGHVGIGEIKNLVGRFIGEPRMVAAFSRFESTTDSDSTDSNLADADMVSFAERQLAGAIGAASARIMIASVVRDEVHDVDEMMQIVDEASQLIEYSRRLEEKSIQLENASKDLKAANVRLLELDKLKDGFVSTVSHELRTPLTSIRSFSEIIYDSPDMPVDQREKFTGIIVKESERLTRLIDDVLDIAKMESGNLEWQMRVLDPREVIDEAINATAGLFRQNGGVLLQANIPDQLPAVQADADRLTQVLINLISNAVKFCDTRKGEVWITARAEEDSLVVSVHDNGGGIDPQDHEKIFERFQQVDNQMSGKPRGSGLGLPICTEIIRQFGGKIWVESELTEGATFTFRIPVAPKFKGVGDK
jgi:Na+/proline symporter/signal transduction histidine kinase